MQKVYSRINWENEPSTNTAISEDNLNKMDYALDKIDDRVVQLSGYQDRVAQSEKNAKQSEINAKVSEENALESELKAKQYMETAFSGTPEGYEALVNQVGLLDIAKSTGNTLYNSKKGGYRLNELVGNTIQNGEPSPDNPIAIENTFDCVEMMQGYYTNTGVYANHSKYVCTKHKTPCNSGDEIQILTEQDYYHCIRFYSGDTYVSSALFATEVSSSCTASVPDGIDSFVYHTQSVNEITPQTVGKVTLTVNGKYVGQIVEHGKNFVNKDNVNIINGYLDSATSTLISGSNHKTLWIPCKPSTNYTTSKMVGSSPRFSIGFTDTIPSVGVVVSNIIKGDSKASLTANSGENGKYLLVYYCFSSSSTTANELLDSIQIEEGTEATPFEPYTEKVTTFLLNEPPRATDRIVRMDGVIYENHKRATVVFDGSESNWSYDPSDGIAVKPLSSAKKVIFANASKSYCDQYIFDNSANAIMKDKSIKVGKTTTSENAFVYIKHIGYANVDDFKARLQANPITVEYELEEETFTPLDTESQLALNSLETFDTVTYIEVDSKVKPTSISGEYGTSQVGAYTLKCMNDNDTDKVERAEMKARLDELAVALVAIGKE